MKAIAKIKLRSVILACGISVFLLSACKNDDASIAGPEFDASTFQALITRISDIQNNRNPSDLEVRLNKAENNGFITEYRIFFIPQGAEGNVDEVGAQGLSEERFLSLSNDFIPAGVSLNENQLDYNGESIMENTMYVAFVLSIGTFNDEAVSVLSAPSTPFSIVNQLEVATLISDFPANDGLFVSEEGIIFASDFGTFNNATGMGDGTTVYEVTPNGDISEKATGFSAPMGGVLDSQGNFYFTHENEGVSGDLIKVAPDGTSMTVGAIAGWPSGLTIDENDNIYVANFVSPTVHRVTPDGTISLFATDSRLAGCVGIDIDASGNVVTANFGTAAILSIANTGEVSLIAQVPDLPANFAIGYMTIFENAIYATGIGDHNIYRINFDGTVTLFAGTGSEGVNDGELGVASFSSPNGIAADDQRRILYISQFGRPGLRQIQF
ncbi:NHL repeat-containing protein [Spongiimicrobium salis]|uniref:hypothetical protein n=1 Tax=Spongiimicrobium salis TaxID=1667022 RepID=UPI00374D81E7